MIYFLCGLLLLLNIYMPWWCSGIVCFFFGYMQLKTLLKSLVLTFASVGIVWVSGAYFFDLNNALASGQRLAQIIHLPHYLYLLSYLLLGFVGGIFGAYSTWLGYQLRRVIASYL